MDQRTLLLEKLAKVESELRDMPSSYSQSNPSHVLGLRSLHRMRDRLLDQLRLLPGGETSSNGSNGKT